MRLNIASLVRRQALERPWQRAVVFPAARDPAGNVAWTQLTFAALARRSDGFARGLAARGVRRGDRVSLLLRPSLDFIPLVFAVFQLGALPVLIDPGMGRRPFLSCLARTAPRVLVAVPLVHALRTAFPRAFRSVEISITAGRSTLWWGGATLEDCREESDEPFEMAGTDADETAAILFTSGSTGPAKGVIYTHGIFAAQTRLIGESYGIAPGEVDLACFPLFGLFSAGLGMTVVIPDLDAARPGSADPARVVEAIRSQGCTSAFGSPAVWRKVAPYCIEHGIALPSLRRILMAGAPIPVGLHEAFQHILPPGAEVHTPYGATESLPVATIGSREVLDETRHQTALGWGTCVGRPAPGIRVRIARITDEPIGEWTPDLAVPDGEVGEICVAGPVVTPGYEREPEHDAQAKIREGDTLWHRIGDVGWIDPRGRIWFCGRKSHRVRTAEGETLFTEPAEAILDGHPDVARTALIGIGGEPVIAVEVRPGVARPREEIARELLAMAEAHAPTRAIRRVEFHPSFPVDTRHNAKIDRPALAGMLAGRGR